MLGLVSELGPAYWYSTQENHRNDSSTYELRLGAEIQGHTILPLNDGFPSFTVEYCSSGECDLIQAWATNEAGKVIRPDFHPEQQEDGTWEVTVKAGNFEREMKANVYINNLHEDSQYRDMLIEEEKFHKAQYEGKYAGYTSDIFDDLWDEERVIRYMQNVDHWANTKSQALKNAENWFWEVLEGENKRSVQEHNKRHCEREKEAKIKVGSSYRLSLKASHPACVENENNGNDE